MNISKIIPGPQIQLWFRLFDQIYCKTFQGCETTGYEEREREICEEVSDRVCTVWFHKKTHQEISLAEFNFNGMVMEVMNLEDHPRIWRIIRGFGGFEGSSED